MEQYHSHTNTIQIDGYCSLYVFGQWRSVLYQFGFKIKWSDDQMNLWQLYRMAPFLFEGMRWGGVEEGVSIIEGDESFLVDHSWPHYLWSFLSKGGIPLQEKVLGAPLPHTSVWLLPPSFKSHPHTHSPSMPDIQDLHLAISISIFSSHNRMCLCSICWDHTVLF